MHHNLKNLPYMCTNNKQQKNPQQTNNIKTNKKQTTIKQKTNNKSKQQTNNCSCSTECPCTEAAKIVTTRSQGQKT